MNKALLALFFALVGFVVFRLATRAPAPSPAPLPPVAEEKAPPLPPADPPIVDSLQGSIGDTRSKAELEELLAKGADANAVDKNGRTALSLAIRNNDRAAVEMLLAKGADPNKRDREMQWTPLMTAAYHAARDPKVLPIVQLLLTKGADPNAAKDGTTPLHVAVNNIDAKAKDVPIIDMLIHAGAKPDGVTAEGPNTIAVAPITLAAWNGKISAALALARGGANLGAPAPGGKTAAQTARDNKHPELAAALEKIEKAQASKAPAAKKMPPAKKPGGGKHK